MLDTPPLELLAFELPAGLDEHSGRDAEALGAGEEIGFMGFQEAQHRGKQRRLRQPFAQIVGAKAGQREQPIGAALVGERPDERRQRQITFVRVGAICFCVGHRLRCPGVPEGERVGQKILVVEDNELNLKLFCDLLRAHGFEAEPVRDGREAIERARSYGPDLIVMDIQMPWISGLELIDLPAKLRILHSIIHRREMLASRKEEAAEVRNAAQKLFPTHDNTK